MLGLLAHPTFPVITSYYGRIASHDRLAWSGSWAIRLGRRFEYTDGISWKHQRAAQSGFLIGWQWKRDGDCTMVVGRQYACKLEYCCVKLCRVFIDRVVRLTFRCRPSNHRFLQRLERERTLLFQRIPHLHHEAIHRSLALGRPSPQAQSCHARHPLLDGVIFRHWLL